MEDGLEKFVKISEKVARFVERNT